MLLYIDVCKNNCLSNYPGKVLTATSTSKNMSTSSSTSDSGVSEGGNVAGGDAATLTECTPQLNSTGSVCTIGSMAKTHLSLHCHC